MRILELEKLFTQETTLDKVLEECKSEIEKVDYWANVMKQGLTDNPEETKKAINELTGCYMLLKSVLAIAESEKSNREVRYYDKTRIELENAGEKFTSASVEKQASAHVANYRRVRNVIEAYVDASEKGISSMQSLIKMMTEEYKMDKE